MTSVASKTQLPMAPGAMISVLGLLAPGAAHAADLDINRFSKYAGSISSAEEQVTSISQFADVKPSDWAYQALSNLIERYGCVAGYPNGSLKGGPRHNPLGSSGPAERLLGAR